MWLEELLARLTFANPKSRTLACPSRPEFGVRPGVTAFGTVERMVRREYGEDAVRVIEGVLEIPNQLSFGFRRIVPTLFAVLRGLVPSNSLKKATCFSYSPKLRTPSNLPTVGM
jgi:hypothetical protein